MGRRYSVYARNPVLATEWLQQRSKVALRKANEVTFTSRQLQPGGRQSAHMPELGSGWYSVIGGLSVACLGGSLAVFYYAGGS
jgi:hypothetical protein